MLHPVDSKHIRKLHSQSTGINISNRLSHGCELDQVLTALLQTHPFACPLLGVHPWSSKPSDMYVRWAIKSRCKDVEKARPLQLVHDIQINDVDGVHALKCLGDCLIRCEVREFDEGREFVEHL